MKFLEINLEERIFGLDILRAIAIILVVFVHGKRMLAPFVDRDTLAIISMDGVTLFFVLSGFLIGRILLKIYFKEGALNWKDLWGFWVRRWFRTVPPYFIVLTVLIALRMLQGFPFDKMYIKFYLFIQNLWYRHPPFFPEAWSLSVEEWFYLSFPMLLFSLALIFKLRSRPAFLFTVGCFFLLSISYRTYLTFDAIEYGIPVRQIYGLHIRKIVLARFDSMMFGVLAAYIFYFHKTFWNKIKNVSFIIGLIMFGLYKWNIWWTNPILLGTVSFTIPALATFFILPKLNSIRLGKGIFAKCVVMISITSYSMYLIHTSIRDVIMHLIPQTSSTLAFISYGIYWILVIIFSILAYTIIEKPIMNFRNKIYSKQSI